MELDNTISGEDASALLDMAVNGQLVDTVTQADEPEENIEDTENVVDTDDVSDTEDTPAEEDLEHTEQESDEDGDSQSQDMEDNGSTEDEDADKEPIDSGEKSDEEEESDESTEDDEDGVDKDMEENSEDLDGDNPGNNDVDVEEYNKLKEFYDKLTNTEFKVNGRKRKGFTEVEDLIKAQQAYGGLEKKFQAVKEVQPFMQSMLDNGFISDPSKYELAVRAVNGDVDALKEVMKNKGIDPLELDLEEEVNYTPRNDVLTSAGELAYMEAKDVAQDLGISSEKLDKVLFEDFDDDSRAELLKDPASIKANSIALAEQIDNGLYDQVLNEIDSMSLRDRSFSTLSMLDKYNKASEIVNEKNRVAYVNAKQHSEESAKNELSKKEKAKAEQARVKAEKDRILADRKKKEYEAKAKEQEAKLASDRRKAAQASKPAPKATSTKKLTPLDLPSEEFSALWDDLLALNDR